VGDWNGNGSTTLGFVDPWIGGWFLRNATSGPPTLVFGFGAILAWPLAGDWDGDLDQTPGSFEPGQRRWSLRNSNSGGAPDIVFNFPPVP
jgi:hypothetical protein